MPRIQASSGNHTASIKANRPSWVDMYRNYPGENISTTQFYPMVSKELVRLASVPNSKYRNTVLLECLMH